MSNHDEQNSLNCAASGGHLEIVRALLAAGADPNKSDYSPLCSVVWSGHRYKKVKNAKERLEIAKLLLDAGTDPNGSRTEDPLVRAADNRNLDMVKLLLDAGADPKTKCRGVMGFTPLLLCCP